MEIVERQGELAGLSVHWREAPADGTRAPILYLHGVPTGSWDWEPFLARTGGVAPDLPGFGRSSKRADLDLSFEGLGRFVEAFADALGLERLSLVMHDWGGVGLLFAQRHPERIERLVLFSAVPFLPGFRWHRTARMWRRRGLGELAMGFTNRRTLALGLRHANLEPLPRDWLDRAAAAMDQGTQRAILRLYRSADEPALARAGARLGELRCRALVLWPTRDPFVEAGVGRRYADALGGPAELELIEGGHWTWLDRPELVDRVARFLG